MSTNKTPSYIGRESCGCCTFIVADMPGREKTTAKEIAGQIKSGRTIERITWEQWVNEVSKEATFMACPHKPKQVELF